MEHLNKHPPTGRSTGAFTLVEMAVSLAVVSVLMVALGTVIVVAAKALPSPSGPSDASIPADAAADQLVQEIKYATSITESTPTSVAFTVADRNGDGVPETIRYAWSGTPAAPVTRQYNGSTPTAAIPAVNSFALTYVKQKHTMNSSSTTTWDSGEITLSTFGGWSGIVATPSTMNLSSTTWAAEKFTIDQVTLPPDITKLSITRVSLKLKKPSSGTAGATVGIYLPSSAGASTPAAAPIGTPFALGSANLSTSIGWVDSTFTDVTFANGSNLNFVILVKGLASTTTASIQYFNAATAPADNYVYRYTTTSGGTWLPSSGLNVNDAPFTVYGSYQRPVVVSSSVDSYTLGSVAITLQPTSSATTRIDTAVEILNEPAITGP